MKCKVLILGGTSGIGLETAKYLKKKKYKVITSGSTNKKLEGLDFIQCDVLKKESVLSMYNNFQKSYGSLNALIYSVGKSCQKSSVENFKETIWHEIIDTNVLGFLRTIKLFYPDLKSNKGRVVVVNSIASRSYSKLSGFEYTASKSALSGIVRHLSAEWVEDEVLINSVFPSMVLTPMLSSHLGDSKVNNLSKDLPLKKLAGLTDISRAIEFLISKKNDYITGSGIDISGGQYLNG